MEDRLGVLNGWVAERRAIAALGNGLQELGGQLAKGLLPGLVVGNDVGPKDTAALASPSMSEIINVELVLALVVLVPLGYDRSSPVGPVVDGLWGSFADYRFVAGVLRNAVGWPALLAACAGDQAFVVGKAVDAELLVPGEGVAFDVLSAPAFPKFVRVVLAVLVEADRLLGPLISGELTLFAPLGDLVGLRAKLVVDLARVVAC